MGQGAGASSRPLVSSARAARWASVKTSCPGEDGEENVSRGCPVPRPVSDGRRDADVMRRLRGGETIESRPGVHPESRSLQSREGTMRLNTSKFLALVICTAGLLLGP